MRKIITLLAIVISISATAQKKDTVPQDTAFIFSIQEITLLKNILLESKVITNGEQLSGKQLQELFAWIDSKGKIFKKEQPKK